jgi:holo-[acyl-carrier protein] synthase
MIYGIGTDIVMVERIQALLERWGDKFARRVLGPDELAEFERRRGKAQHGQAYATRYLAKRFAAKEAFSKALGLGLRWPMTLLSLQILNDKKGKPVGYPSKELLPYCEQLGLTWHISLSDEVDSAVAFVVIEKVTDGTK